MFWFWNEKDDSTRWILDDTIKIHTRSMKVTLVCHIFLGSKFHESWLLQESLRTSLLIEQYICCVGIVLEKHKGQRWMACFICALWHGPNTPIHPSSPNRLMSKTLVKLMQYQSDQLIKLAEENITDFDLKIIFLCCNPS